MVGDVEEAISECLRIVHMDKYLNLLAQVKTAKANSTARQVPRCYKIKLAYLIGYLLQLPT
jgi:hypothetical protein